MLPQVRCRLTFCNLTCMAGALSLCSFTWRLTQWNRIAKLWLSATPVQSETCARQVHWRATSKPDFLHVQWFERQSKETVVTCILRMIKIKGIIVFVICRLLVTLGWIQRLEFTCRACCGCKKLGDRGRRKEREAEDVKCRCMSAKRGARHQSYALCLRQL